MSNDERADPPQLPGIPGAGDDPRGGRVPKWLMLLAALAVVGAGWAIPTLLFGARGDDGAAAPTQQASAADALAGAADPGPAAGTAGDDPAAGFFPAGATVQELGDPAGDPADAGGVAGSDGVLFSLPGRGWRMAEVEEPGAAATSDKWMLLGPQGQTVVVLHTPREPATGRLARGAVRSPLEAGDPSIRAWRATIDDAPLPACRRARCDVFLLDHDDFGGLTVAAGDTGGPSAQAAEALARSAEPHDGS